MALISQLGFGQNFKLIDSFQIDKAKTIIADELGNVYAIRFDNSIELFAVNKNRFAHNDKSLGKISKLDVSNPLRVLAHYSESNVLMFLDNTLTEVGRVSLNDLSLYGQGVVVANSKLGGFWVYDPIMQSISRYDLNGKKLVGNQLSTLEVDFNPNYMIEKEGKVYLASKNGALVILDINGTVLSQFKPSINLKSPFYVIDQDVVWVDQSTLFTLNIQSLNQNELILPFPVMQNRTSKTVAFTSKKCYVLNENLLRVYLIN